MRSVEWTRATAFNVRPLHMFISCSCWTEEVDQMMMMVEAAVLISPQSGCPDGDERDRESSRARFASKWGLIIEQSSVLFIFIAPFAKNSPLIYIYIKWASQRVSEY